MPKVYNIYKDKDIPKDAINIMRPSKWGNSYSHLSNTTAKYKVKTRQEAVDMFEEDILKNPKLIKEIKEVFNGKDVMCCCAPLPCHGDIYIKIANEL